MPLFPTDTRVFTLGLLGYPDQKVTMVDVFPGRITPREGYTMDDAILAFLATSLREHRGWLPIIIHQWTRFSETRSTMYEHPVAQYAPGCFAESLLMHPSLLPEDAIVVRIDRAMAKDHTVSFLGQTHTIWNGFTLHTYGPEEQATKQRHMSTQKRNTPEAFAMALGVITASLDTYTTPTIVSGTAAIIGRFARIATEFDHTSGQAAMKEGYAFGKGLVHHLVQTWELRGASLLDTANLASSQAFRERVAQYEDTPAFAAGQTIARAILFEGIEGSDLADNAAVGASAHATMALKTLQKCIDSLLIAHMPASSLKPMAAKKKAHL